MADKQPEALRALVLADEYAQRTAAATADLMVKDSCRAPISLNAGAVARNALKDELSRQHALIAELVGALEKAEFAMNYMGDILNEMDAVEPEDEDATTDSFESVRSALAKAKEAQQ